MNAELEKLNDLLIKAGRSHLVPKVITDKNGHRRTVMVKPGKDAGGESGSGGPSKEDALQRDRLIAQMEKFKNAKTGNPSTNAQKYLEAKGKLDALLKKYPKLAPQKSADKAGAVKTALNSAGVDEDNHKAVSALLADKGLKVDDIENVTDGPFGHGQTIEVDGEEWAIMSDEEAQQAAEDDIDSIIDDMGISSFRKEFWMQHIDEERLARDLTMDSSHEYDRGYEQPEDFLEEEPAGEDGDFTDAQKVKAGEMAEKQFTERVKEDPMGYLEDIYGSEVEVYFNLENYVDKDALKKDAIRIDGRGHFLSSYDGNEENFGDKNGYRLN